MALSDLQKINREIWQLKRTIVALVAAGMEPDRERADLIGLVADRRFLRNKSKRPILSRAKNREDRFE